jgi:subtilisin family serine protease
MGVIEQSRILVGEGVRVEILHTLTSAEIESLVAGFGGQVYGEVPGILSEALVPIDRLVELEASDGVQYLRPPLLANIPIDPPVEPSGFAPQGQTGYLGQEVSKTNADDWHASGFTGQGVKIGVIDGFDQGAWNAAQGVGEVPSPTGTFCRYFGQSCSIWEAESLHGVGVSEIIHEMAPGAQLYLATVYTASDLQAAVDYFASQGVQIVSRSETAEYDGPGDGTGPIASVVDSAVSKGMMWANAAGNAAGTDTIPGAYWRGGWQDPDGDEFLNFGGGGELLPFLCGFINGLRWNDWGSQRTDYDVMIVDDPIFQIPKTFSGDNQPGGLPPIENIHDDLNYTCTDEFDIDYLLVQRFDPGGGSGGDVLEFMTNTLVLDQWQNQYSASGPMSDSANLGLLSVGAIDPPLGSTIANYSSWGPTNDGRAKPDIAAASCVSSFTYAPDCFNGTSAATPAVSGAAALVISAGLANSPSQVTSYLLNNATVDRGANGTDNIYFVCQHPLRTPHRHPPRHRRRHPLILQRRLLRHRRLRIRALAFGATTTVLVRPTRLTHCWRCALTPASTPTLVLARTLVMSCKSLARRRTLGATSTAAER